MKKIIFSLLTIFTLNLYAKAPTTVVPKYDAAFILAKVLEYKHLEIKNEIAIPKIYFESNTSLKQFQDAIESQWGQRPTVFTNAYSVKNNEIYIMDEAEYYKRNERFIDDSIAHELTHFVQVKYQNFDINDESLEWDAVDIQTWFRENFCR